MTKVIIEKAFNKYFYNQIKNTKTILMMKKITLLTILSVVISIGYEAKTNFANSYSSGAPAGVANDPNGTTVNCTTASCHHGETVSVLTSTNGTVQVLDRNNNAVTSYHPDSTYTVTVNMTSGTGSQNGFESVIEDSTANGIVGTYTPGTHAQNAGSNYMTHTSGSYKTWSYAWTAPSAGTGTVTVFTVVMSRNVATRTNQFNLRESKVSHPQGIEAINEIRVNIFPNPTTSVLNFSANNLSLNSAIEIYSLDGKLMLQSSINNSQNNKLNVADLNAGIYFVKIISGEKTGIAKFVKQ